MIMNNNMLRLGVLVSALLVPACFHFGYARGGDSPGSEVSAAAPAGAWVGICIRTLDGKTLEAVDADRNFIPASNLKAVTAALALKRLGTDFRFGTAVAYSGEIGVDGILDGDLYVVGGGDPTLGSDSPVAVPRDSLFARWERAVRKAGIRSVAGCVVGDSRAMPPRMRESWMYEDLGTYYGASCSGLMFNRNRLEVTLTPGGCEGDAVSAGRCGTASDGCRAGNPGVFIPEDHPWLRIENGCTTGVPGSGDRSFLLVSEFAPAGRLTGTYAVDRQSKTVSFCDPFADFTCAFAFAQHLISSGIPCGGATSTSSCHPTASFIHDASGGIHPAPSFGFLSFDISGKETRSGRFVRTDSLQVLSVTPSPSLWSIVRETLRESDNLFAETLLRAAGVRTLPQDGQTVGGLASSAVFPDVEEALETELELLGELGIGTENIRIDDGSGLSRKTCVSPAFMTDVLRAMYGQSCGRDYVLAFNTPGPDERLLGSFPPEVRRRVRLKSGSMGGVLCYCGYILPAGGAASPSGTPSSRPSADSAASRQDTTVFSIMINGATQPNARLRSYMESLLRPYL